MRRLWLAMKIRQLEAHKRVALPVDHLASANDAVYCHGYVSLTTQRLSAARFSPKAVQPCSHRAHTT